MRRADPSRLAQEVWPFDDARLPELLFRYRARNFASSLTAQEQQRWQTFCRQRLTLAEYGAPNTLADFHTALAEVFDSATAEQQAVLCAWRDYAEQLRQRYALEQ